MHLAQPVPTQNDINDDERDGPDARVWAHAIVRALVGRELPDILASAGHPVLGHSLDGPRVLSPKKLLPEPFGPTTVVRSHPMTRHQPPGVTLLRLEIERLEKRSFIAAGVLASFSNVRISRAIGLAPASLIVTCSSINTRAERPTQ
jgi:hypothetical protein